MERERVALDCVHESVQRATGTQRCATHANPESALILTLTLTL